MFLSVALFFILVPDGVLAQAQPTPSHYAVYDLYIPCQLGIRLPLPDQIIDVKDHITAAPTSGYGYQKGRTPPPDIVYTISWTTNSSDTWTIDIYVNYTQPISEEISYAIQSTDATGMPVGTRQINTRVMGQVIWFHFEITTRIAPHYPSPEEQLSYFFRPDTPLMLMQQANTQTTQNMAEAQNLQSIGIIILILIEVGRALMPLLSRRRP